MNISWTATTSTGRTVTEGKDYTHIDGERKPWIRFLNDLSEGEYLTSLRIKHGKRTVHLPRLNSRFGGSAPTHYSLQYRAELDNILGNRTEETFLDVAAHYGDITVHYIVDLNDQPNSWIEVHQNAERVAPSPNN